jgi:hypothetical protein
MCRAGAATPESSWCGPAATYVSMKLPLLLLLVGGAGGATSMRSATAAAELTAAWGVTFEPPVLIGPGTPPHDDSCQGLDRDHHLTCGDFCTRDGARSWRPCPANATPPTRTVLRVNASGASVFSMRFTLKSDDDAESEPPAGAKSSIEKLGAYVMQAAETSPVNWNGRTLLVETVSGNTPGVYSCCSCTTFGCVANASAHTGYSDCSACSCSAERKAAVGSCAPEFFRIRDANTLAILVSPIPGTEGFAFASAFVADNRLWVYGSNLVNKTVAKKCMSISCFSTADPTSATSWHAREALVLPAGYSVFNTDVSAVADDSAAPRRKYIMSIETNVLAGTATKSWAVFFAETATDPDQGWALVDPTANTVDLSRMTACPAVRFYSGWYYVATTTRGPLCPAAGWANATNALCVIVYRSKTLKTGSWVMGNGGQAIVAPGDSGPRNDRKVMAPWTPTAAELDAIHGHAPQVEGNINDSDFDFCDAPDKGGVFAIWAGIANQRGNPYFNIGGIARNVTSQQWLEGYFTTPAEHAASNFNGDRSPLKSDHRDGTDDQET